MTQTFEKQAKCVLSLENGNKLLNYESDKDKRERLAIIIPNAPFGTRVQSAARLPKVRTITEGS
jgi:hypothetical protein